MRAAVIMGSGASAADLDQFRAGSTTNWLEGLPASASYADAVIIFGGDGTIHRHLPALVRLGLPVLIVPTGSGNDFARALKIYSRRDALRVWRNFESGTLQPRAIDLGVIVASAAPETKHYFCSIAGCGLDSAVARRANQMPRWLRGHGGYVLALLPLLMKLPAFSLCLSQINVGGRETLDGDERPTLLAAFANTQFYGDGMRIAPNADFTDGKLDICRISTMNAFKLVGMFPTVYLGRHLLSPEVKYLKTERVSIRTEPVMEIYADGELVCETPAEISIAAGAFRVICAPS